jgi:glycerol-3-phosphate dehydrogenase
VERLAGGSHASGRAAVRLVRGSHLVLPRLYEGEHAYILQNDDRRIVFMIPYEGRYTLVGTTDVAQASMAEGVSMSAAEEQYLLRAVNRYLAVPARAEDIVWRYAGVRPLYDDESGEPSAVTRDYTLVLDDDQQLPLLSVFGGKITTYRRLAEAALLRLAPWFANAGMPWTADTALPGGEFERAERDQQLQQIRQAYPGFDAGWLAMAFARHGLLLARLLQGARHWSDLGRDFGGGLTEREARWFIENEWAREPDDILWRRTKCGLHMNPAERAEFAAWFIEHSQPQATITQE